MMHDNLHSVATAAGVLCVLCRCGHRAALRKPVIDVYRGNMTPVASLKLKCSRCYQRHGLTLYIPFDEAEVAAFLRGDPFEHRRAR